MSVAGRESTIDLIPQFQRRPAGGGREIIT